MTASPLITLDVTTTVIVRVWLAEHADELAGVTVGEVVRRARAYLRQVGHPLLPGSVVADLADGVVDVGPLRPPVLAPARPNTGRVARGLLFH